MIKWIKVNFFWWTIKKEIYNLVSGESEFIPFAKELFKSCLGLTGDELRKEFIKELAGFTHDQAVKEREKENTKNENAFAEK